MLEAITALVTHINTHSLLTNSIGNAIHITQTVLDAQMRCHTNRRETYCNATGYIMWIRGGKR